MEFIHTLLSNSYFALFVIITFGYLVGKISIAGISLDVSAVIFVALVFGHFGVKLSPVIQDIGLVLFIFTIGLQAGPGFFDALKKHGIKLAILSVCLIFLAGGISVACRYIFNLDMPITAGLLAGALTSTPGLASASDQFGPAASIGYGIAYPFGVIGVILFLRLIPQIMRVNIPKEEQAYVSETKADYPAMEAQNLLVTNKNIDGMSLIKLRFRTMTGAVISRIKHQNEVEAPGRKSKLYLGDIVRVVGTEDALQRAQLLIGEVTDEKIPQSDSIDVQTMLVTNRKIVNKSLSELDLQTYASATVTRIRRSGIDIAPSPSSKLRFGDKLIVSAPKDQMPTLSKLFGNDTKRLSDTDILPIALGIVLGVILGKLTFLGLTGGVLIVALILGRIGKTGPILWTMSGPANQLLREIGLVFFLAVVGTEAGATIVETFQQYGIELFAVGAIITLVPMLIVILIARLVFKMNMLTLLGGIAGGMTSTPGLAAITPITHSNAPQIAYATAYPIAMVLDRRSCV